MLEVVVPDGVKCRSPDSYFMFHNFSKVSNCAAKMMVKAGPIYGDGAGTYRISRVDTE